MYDHRASILAYMDDLAGRYERADDRSAATTVRALAGSLASHLDVEPGRRNVASGVHAAIIAIASALVELDAEPITIAEVLGPSRYAAVIRVRYGAMWVAKKRLGWDDERLAAAFNRDRTSLRHGIDRAGDIRRREPRFERITDNIAAQPLCCEHCLKPLETA